MLSMDVLLIILVIVLTGRDVYQVLTIQKLVNKLMSRNYHDYEFSKNVSKTMDQDKVNLKDGLKAEMDLGEDLSPISSFGVN